MECADAALAAEGELGERSATPLAMAARGRAHLALGDLDRARGALLIAHRVMDRRGAMVAAEIAEQLRPVEGADRRAPAPPAGSRLSRRRTARRTARRPVREGSTGCP